MKNAEGLFSAFRSQIERNLHAIFFIGPFLVGIAFTPSLAGYSKLKEAESKRKRVQKSRSYRSVISRGELGNQMWIPRLPLLVFRASSAAVFRANTRQIRESATRQMLMRICGSGTYFAPFLQMPRSTSI